MTKPGWHIGLGLGLVTRVTHTPSGQFHPFRRPTPSGQFRPGAIGTQPPHAATRSDRRSSLTLTAHNQGVPSIHGVPSMHHNVDVHRIK